MASRSKEDRDAPAGEGGVQWEQVAVGDSTPRQRLKVYTMLCLRRGTSGYALINKANADLISRLIDVLEEIEPLPVRTRPGRRGRK